MSEKPKNPNYSINRIFVKEMYLSPLEIGQEAPTGFKQTIAVYQQVLGDSGVVMVTTKVEIISEDLSTIHGVVSVLTAFRFNDFNDFITNKDQPNYDMVHELNNHAIATTRGVMFSFFRGTYLNDAILPIIDSQELEKSVEEVIVNQEEE